jgi:uncharacterized protein YecE (DUF72 family)
MAPRSIPTAEASAPGRLYAGTSGFAYPGWIPRFYPRGLRGDAMLRHYGSQLNAVELNNTFYQQPSAAKVAAWLEATLPTFRFSVKAQRGGSWGAFGGSPEPGLPWLTGPYRAFRERLGTVLVRAPDTARRDDERLAAFLAAWPRDLPLTVELRDPSWQADETVAALSAAGAALCATDDPDEPLPPDLRRTAPFLYLRLRRHDYTADEIATWADRLAPFLAEGDDVFVFFRHDEVGRGPELALELTAAVASLGGVAAR